MARIASLSILLDPTGKAFLKELYGDVIQNVEKGTISGLLKNTNLSGDPEAGSVEAQRIAFAKSQTYGTARTAGKGNNIKMKPVTVQIDNDKEIIEEIENKDVSLMGVDGLLEKRAVEHQAAMIRELEYAFFDEAVDAGTKITITETDPQKKFEKLVLQLETTKNDYVNGVSRDLIHVILSPGEYSELRQFINTDVNNANINTTIENFGILNGVMVYSSIHLPVGTKGVAMVKESVALPVKSTPYGASKIPQSEAFSVELFYYYGKKAVMPDLILSY